MDIDAFCRVASHFLENEDEEALQKELKEAFRLYDKEGNKQKYPKTKSANHSARDSLISFTKVRINSYEEKILRNLVKTYKT